jgi:hypothetical protein
MPMGQDSYHFGLSGIDMAARSPDLFAAVLGIHEKWLPSAHN